MDNILITEKKYNEILEDVKNRLGYLTGLMTIITPEYKLHFTKNGNWNKTKRFFSFTFKIVKSSKKTDNILRDTGKIIMILSDFIEEYNNEYIYMLSEIATGSGSYSDQLQIKVKFISYDMAAKILLIN